MEPITFDLKQLLVDLTQFDQAAANSAQMLNSHFTIQLEALSSTLQGITGIALSAFGSAFAGIDAISNDSALIMGEAFSGSTADIIASLQELHTVGEGMFTALFDASALSAEASAATYAEAAGNINNSFTETAQAIIAQMTEINAAAAETAFLMTDAFMVSSGEIDAAIQNTQITGSSEFALLSDNVSNSSMTAKETIFAGLDELSAKFTDTGLGIQSTMFATFENMTSSFSNSLSAMFSESNTQFINIRTNGEKAAAAISKCFSDKFSEILTNLTKLKTDAEPVLSGMQSAFAITAENAQINFNVTQTSISQDMNIIGNDAKAGNEKAKTGFIDTFESSSKLLSTVNSGLSIFKSLKDLFGGTKDTAAGLTQILNINTGVQMANTGATATAGATSAGAGTAFLYAGAGALMLGGGVLACAMGIALLAKVAFNALKLFGVNTNGVQSSDFNMSFSVPGLADGGIPTTGQMFWARESGPEIVASFGGRTGVMNNDQIVESVSEGVHRAVREAMREQNQILRVIAGKDTSIVLDGKEITKAVERIQKERGLTLLAGPNCGA